MTTCTSCTCEPPSDAELLARLDAAIAENRRTAGALIPVLQIAQGIYGHLPDVAIRRICTGLDKSYSEVAGVIGFYSFFSTHPRGKHTIRICLGTACYVRGAKKVLETFRQQLGVDVGQTTPDRRFTLEVARCLGACGMAPACLIGEDVHQSIKPSGIPAILSRYA